MGHHHCVLSFCWKQLKKPLLIPAVATLMLLPFFAFGNANDFMMRTTAPAVIVLAALCAQAISVRPLERCIPLIICLTLGSVTLLGEMGRTLRSPRLPDFSKITIEEAAPDSYGPQYLSSKPWVIR